MLIQIMGQILAKIFSFTYATALVMAFDVSETRVTSLAEIRHSEFYSFILLIFLLDSVCPVGDEIVRATKREDDVKEPRSRIPSHTTSTIAEEAVDQLQASEKLIAGK